MGQSPSIQELAEQEEAFRKYLAQIRTEVEKDRQADTDRLEEMIKKYYADGGWKYAPLMQGDQLDVQQISTWSLGNVIKILNSVRDAVFGNADPPAGVVVTKPESFLQSFKQMESLNLLVLNKAFSLIQGVLETFATETSYRGQAITKVDVVSPGLTLFVSIRSDVWRSKDWFNNKYIGQYLYVMRAFYSSEQAGDWSKFSDLLAYEELKAAFRTRMLALSAKIGDPKTPYSALPELSEEMGTYSEALSDLQAKIEELLKSEVAAHRELAKRSIEQRRAAAALNPQDE